MLDANPLKSFRSSPLWLIGLFIIFAEGTAGLAAVNIDGVPQLILVIFVVTYATLVTTGFFVFLWIKPENFYSPTDYGGMDPSKYRLALRGIPERTADVVEAQSNAPYDENSYFDLLDNLVADTAKQHVVLMRRLNSSLSAEPPKIDESNTTPFSWSHEYQFALRNGSMTFGGFLISNFLDDLKGTDLVRLSEDKKEIQLTRKGQDFADWMISNERDALVFSSDIGGWGDKRIIDEQLKSRKISKIVEKESQ